MATRLKQIGCFVGRFWFPLALVVVLLLAVPGFMLLGLNLYGKEAPVNQFLERAYQLSYHISLPWWAGLLLLFIPVLLVLLYLLKLKRKPLSVPSTFLWKKSIEDLHVNSLLQWLRENVLLLLQMLAVLAMIYGIMGFRFHGATAEGKHYILMIDNSASMSATDLAPNRLEWAKQEALKEVDASTENDVGMVIVFNATAEIRQSYTSNQNLIREAVKRIEQTQRPTHIEEALSLADSQANPSRSTDDNSSRPAGVEPGKERTYVQAEGISTEVHLFSDGRFPDVPEFSLGNLNLHYHAAGEFVVDETAGPDKTAGNEKAPLKVAPVSADNVGVVAMNATLDEQDSTKMQVFVRALNFRSESVHARLQLEMLVNGELKNVYEKTLPIAARQTGLTDESSKEAPVAEQPGEGSASFDLSEIDDRANLVFHARLKDLHDQFPLDDEAWLVVGVVRKARILMVGNPNDILEKFFEADAVQEVARVDHLAPEDLTRDAYRKPARNGVYDFIIFDRCAPASEQDMPRSNTFFIGRPPPPWRLDHQEKISNPHITGWMNRHPVLRDLAALYTIDVDQAFKMKDLPLRTPLLIEARQIGKNQNVDTALLLSLNRHSFTDLVMTFPILTDKGEWNTTWPLQTSFPLFLRNVLYHLGNLSDSTGEESVQPGQVKTIRPDAMVKGIEVIGPGGKTERLSHDQEEWRTDFTFGGAEQVGIYLVKWKDRIQRRFAVNLLDAEESNIAPRPVLQIGNEHIAAGQERKQPRELWKCFAVLALGVLLLEWYIYNRRIYI